MSKADHPIISDPPVLGAALWAAMALGVCRRRLHTRGLDARVPPVPPFPERAVMGVSAMLDRRGATCLERSLVLQRWLAAHGTDVDVLIGVAGGGEAPDIHAWLEGVDGDAGVHRIIHRIAPDHRLART